MFRRLINLPSWLIFGGLALQALGVLVASEAWWGTDQFGEVYHNSAGVVVGGIITWVGFWTMVTGFMALAVKYVIPVGPATPMPAHAPTMWAPLVAPAQHNPAEVASDPNPFVPHANDSAVIAEVRRSCGRGSRRTVVQRIVNKASRAGQLTEHDRDMAEAILVEAIKRPLGPVTTRV